MASETASAVASTELGVVVLSSALRLTVRLKVVAILSTMYDECMWNFYWVRNQTVGSCLLWRRPQDSESTPRQQYVVQFHKNYVNQLLCCVAAALKVKKNEMVKSCYGPQYTVGNCTQLLMLWCVLYLQTTLTTAVIVAKNMINPCHWWLYGIQQRRQIKVLLSFIYKRKHWKLQQYIRQTITVSVLLALNYFDAKNL